MSNLYSENSLTETPAIELFKTLWWEENFINAFSEIWESKLERNNRSQVILNDRLKQAIIKLNPWISEITINQVIDIFSADKSQKSLVSANKEIYEMMKNWVHIDELQEDWSYEAKNIAIIDWNLPENNDFLLVSQMWITWELYERRPDLIGFVNGIPLLIVELKSPNKNLFDAFNDNIRDYKDTIPQLFWYNAFIILSNWIENKIWSLTANFEHYSTWKRAESEKEELKTDLKTLINWTCDKNRFLDIVENFTLFDETEWKISKIVAKYHQYYGVNTAIESLKNKDKNDWKLWVFWHTQWSWKSFSMMFFSNKILRKLPWNHTFVIITDRDELDKQIYKWFVDTWIVKEKEVKAKSIEHLKELLATDHRFVFSLIHKFQKIENINDRDDIIVITDEAHRTQYWELAMNLRMCLPKANFIWFTWTPLIDEEIEKTKALYGDYVSVYNFAQSVEDGATVPIYYENRIPRVENTNSNLQNDIDNIIEKYELDEDEQIKLDKTINPAYEILTREDRLESVASDIVNHFMNRGNTWKAMVVCIDKKTTVRLYTKVKKYFEEYKNNLKNKLSGFLLNSEREKINKQIDFINDLDLAVVLSLTNNQNEIDDFKKFWIDFKPIRERILKEDIETKFKDEKSNLKMVFVCSMWITGFDVPSITTLYLDKPMKNHTLMQTIARTNRVFTNKQNWLIVDYIWVFNNLQKALAIYAWTPWNDIWDVVENKAELVVDLEKSIWDLKIFLKSLNLDLDYLYSLTNWTEILEEIRNFVDVIFVNDETKKRFTKLAWIVNSLYESILPDTKASSFQKIVKLVNFILEAIRQKWFNKADITLVQREISELLDKSIEAETFVIEERFNYKDLSKLPFEELNDYFSKSKKNIETQKLMWAIEEKLSEMIKKNKTRLKFVDKLTRIIDDYNNSSKNVDETFNDLIELAKLISEEDKRALQENLSEDELAIFDLLLKPWLTPEEEQEVKKVSSSLLKKIKDKLVIDWRKSEPKRADVEVWIEDYLFYNLPRTYDWWLVKFKSHQVYMHVYENYSESSKILV